MMDDSSPARTVVDQKSPGQIGFVWWWCQEIFWKYFSIIVLKFHFYMVIPRNEKILVKTILTYTNQWVIRVSHKGYLKEGQRLYRYFMPWLLIPRRCKSSFYKLSSDFRASRGKNPLSSFNLLNVNYPLRYSITNKLNYG